MLAAMAEKTSIFDLAIVGGGVNGVSIARDAAGRGLRVYLCERDDLAGATSSRSTKLIHGGLRYLEYYSFRLVREALAEREVLWAAAPHIIWPLRFVLPHHAGLRPAWLLRAGLFLYDHIGGRERLPPTRVLDLRSDEAGAALKRRDARAFEYSDCWVDDSRFVVLNAMDAQARGAVIETRHELADARREDGLWRLTIADRRTGLRHEKRAKVLVNAAGPWVGAVRRQATSGDGPRARLVKGSHIVTPKLFEHERPYIFQNADKRIVFAIPYERDFTLIGTTDVDYEGDPAAVRIAADEVSYLCEAANRYFAHEIAPTDVVWSYSGVRALFDDGASAAREATRDYKLDLDTKGGAPLLSVFGGKLTTSRRLAEGVIDGLAPHLPSGVAARRWTARAHLPGGDFPMEGFPALLEGYVKRWPGLPPPMLERLARAYGTLTPNVLGNARTPDDLGRCFGADLYEAELRHLIENEWAQTAADVLWRRSKLGLRVSPEEARALDAHMRRDAEVATA